MAEYEVVREVQKVELTVDEKENGDLTVYVVCGGVSQKILMTRL